MNNAQHKALADRLKRIKTRPPDTWITPLVHQMAEFAQDPTHWWIFTGQNNPCPFGCKPEDFVQVKDNIIFRVTVELVIAPAAVKKPLLIRKLQLGSDKYSAAELPPVVVDEAKRAFFGLGVPMIKGSVNGSDRTKDYWQFSHIWHNPQAYVREAMGKQGLIA